METNFTCLRFTGLKLDELRERVSYNVRVNSIIENDRKYNFSNLRKEHVESYLLQLQKWGVDMHDVHITLSQKVLEKEVSV